MAGVVYNCITLVVWCILYTSLEADSTPVELAQLIVKVLIYSSCVYELISKLFPIAILAIEEVYIGKSVNSFEKTIYQLVVTINRNTLILVVKVVIIEYHADRKTLDDESRQFFAVTPPLLLSILFDELIEDILSYQTKSLLLKVLRFTTTKCSYSFCFLLIKFCLRFSRSMYIRPHLVEGVHVERQVE